MNLHDAVLESAGLTSTREFRIVLTEIPGQPHGTKLVLGVRGATGVVFMGSIEEDWFLSSVQLTSPSGTSLSIPAASGTAVGRIIVMGTNGAFVEVIGGELHCAMTTP